MRVLFACLIGCLLSGAVLAEPVKIPNSPRERPRLKSIYAGVHQIRDFQREDTKALVFIFMGCDCPVAQQYVPTLKQMHEDYQDRGVVFLAIYSNSGDNLVTMAHHAHDADYAFPALLDEGHRLADLLEAERTPEVIVLDDKLEKRYQGAIDNQFTKRGRIEDATKHYLLDAIGGILAGEPIENDYTDASGCPIERQPRPKPPQQLTYHRDVAPIVQRSCESCHREGKVGPFELSSFEDVYYNATKIAEVVRERRMPPWHGYLNPKYGNLHNDKRLSQDEIDTILGWMSQGAPEGDPADAPPPMEWPDPNAWEIGTPDFVYKMPEPFRVPKTGILEYQFFRVKLNFPQDRWFNSVEVRPGNEEVVHHVGLHIVPSGNRKFTGFAGMSALYGLSTEKAQLVNDYVPGDTYNAKIYPSGQAVRIPAGSDLVYELHYTPNNREAPSDQSMVAFKWCDAPGEEVFTAVFRKAIGRFRIPAHDPHYRMVDSYYFERDVWVDAIRPHFHLRAKSFRVEIVKRNEETDEIIERETLLSVPVWDPDWQRTYELETPLLLQAGTELLAIGIFDNSELNPNNPDPTVTVHWGQQTSDEIFSTRFKYRLVNQEAEPPR